MKLIRTLTEGLFYAETEKQKILLNNFYNQCKGLRIPAKIEYSNKNEMILRVHDIIVEKMSYRIEHDCRLKLKISKAIHR